jgi:vacuolar-type H+-ATPase subunit E/Vma4
MNILQIVAQIEADAQREAAGIALQESQEVANIRAETARMIEQARKRMEAEVRIKQEEEMHRTRAKQQLEIMQTTLRCKQELLDELFAQAEKEVHGLPRSDRAKIIARLVQRAKNQMSVAYVTAATQDAKLIRGIRTKTAKGLGGFVAHSKDDRIRLDLRFETLLAEVRRKSLPKIAELLFRESKINNAQKPKTKKRKVKR